MWKYEILDWVLPKHAQYLQTKGCPRDGECKDYFFSVLEVLDGMKLVRIPTEPHISIVAIGAPLIAHNVQKLKHKLETSQVNL